MVYDGKTNARGGQLFETRAKSFVTKSTTSWLHGQVVVRISDGKTMTRGPTTLSMDADLKSAIEKYGEKVRSAEHRAAYPARRRRIEQRSRDAARSLPWWA